MNRRVSPGSQAIVLAPVWDGLAVAVSGWIAYYLRWSSWVVATDYLYAVLLGTTLTAILLPLTGAYAAWDDRVRWRDFGHAIPGIFLVLVALALVATFSKTTAEFSRLWMAYWFALAIVALVLSRSMVSWMDRVRLLRSPQARSVLILGHGALAGQVAEQVQKDDRSPFDILGFIAANEPPSSTIPEDKVLGHVDDLGRVLRDFGSQLDEAWIAIGSFQPQQLESFLEELRSSVLLVRFFPDLLSVALINRVPREIAGMMAIDLNASPLQGSNAIIKGVFDRLFSFVALLLLSPLLVLIGILIKLDSPGPAFFAQKRLGCDGRVISVFKFRTMAATAAADESAPQAKRNDPRVTRLGAFLRKTSLDELPQFVNVLIGDMSVVGPRPHPLQLNERYRGQITAYMQRHRVKPGITGWAQIHGFRGGTENIELMRRRIEYDLYYIEHWSLWLDVSIIVRTLLGGWTDEHAY